MKKEQFISACKSKGVNIKSVVINKKSVKISYNYDLPNDQLSQTHAHEFYYTGKDRLLSIFKERFENADKSVRF